MTCIYVDIYVHAIASYICILYKDNISNGILRHKTLQEYKMLWIVSNITDYYYYHHMIKYHVHAKQIKHLKEQQ